MVVVSFSAVADWFSIEHRYVSDPGPGCILQWVASQTHVVSIGLCSWPVSEGPFTIYRDGEAIAVVTNTCWFRDMTAEAGRSYSYVIAGYGVYTPSPRTMTCPMSYQFDVDKTSLESTWRGGNDVINVTACTKEWTNAHYGESQIAMNGDYYLRETTMEWKAVSEVEWINVVDCAADGSFRASGTASLNIDVLQNKSGEARLGHVSLWCAGIEVMKISVAQGGMAAGSFPQIGIGTSQEELSGIIDSIGFADRGVKGIIGGSVAEYSRFREWAQNVDGGEAAVLTSPYSGAAYLLGAEKLFRSTPKVTIGDFSMEKASTKGAQGLTMTVSVEVADGDDIVAVAAEKVASLFEATCDLGDWYGASRLKPEVSVLSEEKNGRMYFRVRCGGDNAPRAFLRVKVQ